MSACPQCGGPMPAARLSGLCPRCVTRRLLTADSPQETPAHEAELPEVAEGLKLGRYTLREKLGEGGFGVVHAAEQHEPVRRRVAIKIVKLGMDTRSVVARFEAERQAVALMDHPNIARVFDAGATDTGRPFFVMELVSGARLTDYCEQRQLDLTARLELFIQVCQAVQHAHQKGVIHRDLKPSNILVAEQDGVAVPKIIDFGIAKAVEQPLTESTLVTRFDHFIGTPAYMSPEQAELGGLDIDTRSDIYSLGVLLYELLCGTTPFDVEELRRVGSDEARRIIREVEPPRPSTRLHSARRSSKPSSNPTLPAPSPREERVGRGPGRGAATSVEQPSSPQPSPPSEGGEGARPESASIRGDLDWIVMKCLEKDRARRYETASALALDLRRHLDHEPVSAAAPSATYRFGKFARRHRAAFAAITSVAVILLAAVVISSWLAFRATRAEDALELRVVEVGNERDAKERARQAVVAEQRVTRRMNYAADTYLAQRALEAGNFGRARRSLDEHRPRNGEEDLRGFEWRYLWQRSRGDQVRVLRGHSNVVASVAFAPDGKTIYSAGWDNSVRVWDVATGELRTTLPLAGQPQSVVVSADGNTFAAGTKSGRVQRWDARTFEPGRAFSLAEARLAFAPDGTLAAGFGGSPWGYNNPSLVKLFDASGERELLTLTNAGGRVAFSPDGKLLASGSFNNEIKLWEMPSGRRVGALRGSGRTLALAIAPDGRTLATCDYDTADIRLWDIATQQAAGTLPGHELRTSCLAFSPDGQRLATGGLDQKIRLLDVSSGELLDVFAGHGEAVEALAFSPDGQWIASASRDETVMLWPARVARAEETLTNVFNTQGPGNPVFSRDGTQLAAARDGQMIVFDAATLEPRTIIASPSFPLAFSPDARELVTFSHPSSLQIWDVATGTNRARLNTRIPFNREAQAALAPDGRLLAVGGADTVALYDVARARRVGTLTGHRGLLLCVEFSPDGKLLATAGMDSVAKLWDATTFREIATLRGHQDIVRSLAFTPDGRALVTGSHDHTARLWAVPSGEPLATLTGHRGTVSAVAVSPDGRTLASTGPDRTVKLWHLETRREVASFAQAAGRSYLHFPADRHTLVLGNFTSRTLTFWRAPSLAEIDGVTNAPSVTVTNTPPPWLLAGLGTPEFAARQRPVFPARASGLETELIDLSLHYNRLLTDPLHNNPTTGNDFAELPTGRQTFANVPWDVRGIIEVASRRTGPTAPELPEKITGLKIAQRAARLHFLHGCGYAGGNTTQPMGRYVVNYADGESADVPIVLGRDVLDWWSKPPEGATELVVAWSGQNANSRAARRTIQLYKTTWENPRPNVEIVSVDFVSAMADAAPFLVAITAER